MAFFTEELIAPIKKHMDYHAQKYAKKHSEMK